jgi:hypothetical protein
MALSLEDAARLMLESRTIAGVNGVYSILLISTFLGDSIYIVFMQGKIKRDGPTLLTGISPWILFPQPANNILYF